MYSSEITFFEIFPWNKNFNTGIDIIDEQHKQLVDILNRLAAHLANLSSSVTLNEIFDELAEYADYHFKTEEKIWSEHLHDDEWFSDHEHTHESFIAKVVALKNEEKIRPLDEVIYEVVSFLSQWLAYHILDSDKRMARAVLAIEEGNSIEEAKIRANEEMSGSMKVLIHTVLSMYDSLSTRTLDLMREKTLRRQAEVALHKSEERWKFILEGGAENIWDWDIEHDTMTFSKEDIPLVDLVSDDIERAECTRIHKIDKKRVENDFKAHLEGKTEFFTSQYRILRKNGSWAWVLSRGKVVSRDEEGRALRMVGTHSDITERELASLIYKNSSQAMLISDINNIVISVNPAFTKITGYSEDEAIGKNPKFMTSGLHNAAFYNEMWERIEETGHWTGEISNRRKNGELYTEMLNINTVTNAFGSVDHYVGLFNDITEQKKADELILEHANIDPLTRLHNRRMFLERLDEEIKRSKRSGVPFALLYMDLDHFKEVNDSLGHDAGDKLLIEVTQRMKNHVRESDIVSRLGGDEFSIIFTDLQGSFAIDRITQDIIDSMCKPFQLDVDHVYISASVGITIYPNDADDASTLLKNADQAMYLAKRSGRACYRYFKPSMQEAAERRQVMINDLHGALDEKQFQVFYQPIVDMKTAEINKAEALVRWNHPERGLVSPDDFIPLAEESGQIIEIGDWVFKEAMRQTDIWKRKYHTEFQVSVNKSQVQFRSARKLDEWLDYLNELGLNGHNIVIEITESILMEDESRISDKLLQLRDMGIEVSLDDFGTGYSSLSYLKKFDIDYLKIDRSFVASLTAESTDMALCEAMIVMAHKLGIKVIAEGIETEEQKHLLDSMGCDYGQGYLFSRPVPASEFEKLLN